MNVPVGSSYENCQNNQLSWKTKTRFVKSNIKANNIQRVLELNTIVQFDDNPISY